ncbi:hypothetical protein C5167_015725, partial [Papaver somniferum]
KTEILIPQTVRYSIVVNGNHTRLVSVKTLVIHKNEGRNIPIYGEEGSLEGGINHDVTAAASIVKINDISLADASDNGTYACVRFDNEDCLNSICQKSTFHNGDVHLSGKLLYGYRRRECLSEVMSGTNFM